MSWLTTLISPSLNIPHSISADMSEPIRRCDLQQTGRRRLSWLISAFVTTELMSVGGGEEKDAGRAASWPHRALSLLWHKHLSAEMSILRSPSYLWGGKVMALISCKSLLSLAKVKNFVSEILVGVLWSVKHSRLHSWRVYTGPPVF